MQRKVRSQLENSFCIPTYTSRCSVLSPLSRADLGLGASLPNLGNCLELERGASTKWRRIQESVHPEAAKQSIVVQDTFMLPVYLSRCDVLYWILHIWIICFLSQRQATRVREAGLTLTFLDRCVTGKGALKFDKLSGGYVLDFWRTLGP